MTRLHPILARTVLPTAIRTSTKASTRTRRTISATRRARGSRRCTDAVGNQDGKWCAALNIDSVQSNSNTGVANNAACNNLLGPEPVNFAIITKSGAPVAPASPDTGFGNQAIVTADTLECNNGDQLTVDMHDTPAGFQVVIHDLTTGKSGLMTASIANGFGHGLFQPGA